MGNSQTGGSLGSMKQRAGLWLGSFNKAGGFQRKDVRAQRRNAASRNRIQTCPQITQINADTEKEYSHLRPSACSAGKGLFSGSLPFAGKNPRAYACDRKD
jgi:hypothetical protein